MRRNRAGWRPGLRESALFDRNAIHEIQRAAREGIYDIRGFGAKRQVPHFDDLLFLGASMSRYPLEGYRERCDTDVDAGRAPRAEAAPPGHPDHDRRHELRRALGAGEGGARPRRERGGHEHHHRRRRHDARGARALEHARLPAAAVALRHEPGRPAPRRRDRDRGRPGREAGRRAGCCSARRSRTAWPRCATCRRGSTSAAPAGIPTGPGPDDLEIKIHELREITDWEKPVFVKVGATRPVLRHRAGREVRRRRGRAGRHAGRHGGHAGGLHRARGHPHARRDPPGRGGAPGARRAPRGAARRVRRDPLGRRRGEGAGARRRRGVDRRGGDRRARRQLARARGGLRGDRRRRPATTTTGTRGATRPASRPRTTSWPRASTPSSAAAGSANYLRTMVLEAQTIARACGKSHVHNLEPEDLVALTIEAAAMARVPLAGTGWVPGPSG